MLKVGQIFVSVLDWTVYVPENHVQNRNSIGNQIYKDPYDDEI